jgi:RNA recognition motif-containing protein
MVCNTVSVSNFPANFREKELRNLFESSLLLSTKKLMQPIDPLQYRAVIGCVIVSAN